MKLEYQQQSRGTNHNKDNKTNENNEPQPTVTAILLKEPFVDVLVEDFVDSLVLWESDMDFNIDETREE